MITITTLKYHFKLLLLILDELPGTVSLLLTNALWFKDSWNQPFDEVLEP